MNKLLFILVLSGFASCTMQNENDVKLSHYTIETNTTAPSLTVIFDQERLDKPTITIRPMDISLIASR